MESSPRRLLDPVASFSGGSAFVSPTTLSQQAETPSRPRPQREGATRGDREASVTDFDIVIPVYDGERMLAASVRRLHRFLTAGFPFSWRIIIADNASTDRTPVIAARLSDELPGVQVLRVEAKGRGRALRAAWSASSARVVCYMDADLSTDLNGLLPLVAPLLSGHSDLAIGTRLARGARVTRSPKRELISRSYNRLLRVVLRARFSDAQCGFKAVRGDIVGELLAGVRDESWFFDTELLILAQRRGLRIHEVPVDWVEGPESSVDILATAVDDLRGVLRLMLQLELSRFVVIGVIMTIAYALLYVGLRIWLGASLANALALGVLAPVNTQVNRRYTFGVRGRARLLRQHAAGALVYALALALTEGALRLLHGLVPHAARVTEVMVLIVASAAATLSRYVALRTWVFARAGTRGDDPAPGLIDGSQHLATGGPSLPAPANYSRPPRVPDVSANRGL
jgi:glycosyltransferase involved in cell wall biosynthesis